MRTLITFLLLGVCLTWTHSASADASIPMRDGAAVKDLSWLPRYEGSLLLSGTFSAYDEYPFATGPLVQSADADARDEKNNRVFDFKSGETLEGARTRLVYLLPAGRSPLEILRGYEQTLGEANATKRFECAAAACGGDASRNSGGGGGEQSVAMKLWPRSRIGEEEFTNGNCAQTMDLTDQRFASFSVPERGYVMVHSFSGRDNLYCKAFNERTIVIVDVLELKAREQKMVTVSATDMQKAIASTGRVALYGIYFDTGSSVIKAESKASLDEIAKLLQLEPSLKLHVVGHTDNQGGLEQNFALSKARAQAVSTALQQSYGIAAARLSANGVSALAPVASNTDEAGRAKNRRVELVPF
ncbi:MAG: OmpA family protein [Rhodanobacteraceae bacterium]|nr:OmpA family protein [Rhodanobacteraceae bacterium]MBK7044003.1 OmpA family protein [Rhodanobacteraceae bacterium]MBP9155948.1 OmpA family protein [Xanthomonadales bacterium]